MTCTADLGTQRAPAISCEPVADKRKDAHTVRVPEENLWEEFEAAAGELATTPSAVLRNFMKWYVRRPRSPLPQRPGKD